MNLPSGTRDSTRGSIPPCETSTGPARVCNFSSSVQKLIRWARAPQYVLGALRAGTRVQWQQWKPTEDTATAPCTPHPSRTGGHSQPRASGMTHENTTPTACGSVQPQQPPEQDSHLTPSRSLVDGGAMPTLPTLVTH